MENFESGSFDEFDSVNQLDFLSGLVITPPVIGRVSIGGIDADYRPYMDDGMQITSLSQRMDNSWIPHPISNEVRTKAGVEANQKLQSIPVHLVYDNPNLNFSAKFIALEDETGRVLCQGNKGKSVRLVEGEYVEHNCPGSDRCDFGITSGCKPHGRLFVQIDGQKDFLGVFVHRTSGMNTTRYLSARLSQMFSMMRGKIAGFPLSLVMRAKTTQVADGSIMFLDLEFREGMSLSEMKTVQDEYRKQWDDLGWDRKSFEKGVKSALEHGYGEIDSEDGLAIKAEFYNASKGESKAHSNSRQSGSTKGATPRAPVKNSLADLALKIQSELSKPSEKSSTEEDEHTLQLA